MTQAEIQALLDQTRCLACYGMSLADLIKIGLLENIAAAGGGSGGGGPTCGAYGGGEPTFVPASGCGNAIDTDTDRVWWYYLGAWH